MWKADITLLEETHSQKTIEKLHLGCNDLPKLLEFIEDCRAVQSEDIKEIHIYKEE